jgi:hypothetical protein
MIISNFSVLIYNDSMRCPFCKNRINRYDGHHIYKCNKNLKLISKKDIKYEYLSYNFPVISNKNVIFDEYVIKLKSLPEINKNYNISYKNILFLLDYYEIKKRTMKISSKQISVKKYKNTIMNKYGVDNISKLQSIKNKKKNKSLNFNKKIENIIQIQKYFISNDNNFKNTNIDKDIKKDLLQTYKKNYKHWFDLTDEQKYFLIDETHHPIETRISYCLDMLNITYIKNFKIGEKKFDLKIKNLLIEVNGDLWHANPLIYKENEEPSDIKNIISSLEEKEEILEIAKQIIHKAPLKRPTVGSRARRHESAVATPFPPLNCK